MPCLRGSHCRGLAVKGPLIYVAGSFRHRHGVRLLARELARMGCSLLDWTEKATPPPGLSPAARRQWMDTDLEGGQVYRFCHDACRAADLVIYYGESGQDAGVEVGLAAGSGVPVLGIRGPLEAPGLMLHGAAGLWVESVEEALDFMRRLLADEPGDAFSARLRARWQERLARQPG